MQNVITNEQVISLAFSDGEYVSPDVVLDSEIDSAAHRYIVPIVGKEFYKEMLDGAHQTLVADFVAPALAMAVRTVIQPALNVRTGQGGLYIPTSTRSDTATRGTINGFHKSLRLRRDALLRRLSDYLRDHAEEYPSYDAERDIMQKYTISGGYVQNR